MIFFFQVIGRLILIVLFNYCWGKGLFFPSMAFVAIHVFVFTAIVTIFQWKVLSYELNFTLKTFTRVFYNSFNGLANLYCCNWIESKSKDKLKKKIDLEFNTISIMFELGTQLLFLLENFIIFISCWYSFSLYKEGGILKIIAAVSIAIHFLGAILKMLYYWKFYIWRNLIWKDFAKQYQSVYKCLRRKNVSEENVKMSELKTKVENQC